VGSVPDVLRATPSIPVLPTGTVTFAFSDIEGSTQRWDAYPETMREALRRHDSVLRGAIEAHGGHVFKTIGDAFCAAFPTAPGAVAAALTAQRALAAEDFTAVDGLRVRIALHTGHADERDGDYFGATVNRVARLLAIGHGGQVLVSGTTADLLHGAMPPHSTLWDLGEHRLKDLERPEHVYQLIAPELAESFAGLRSSNGLPNNLPRQLTSFVGRDDVMAQIAALVERASLVTLVGTGGAGKTRCAVQVGADLIESSGGVWFVELAPLSDRSLVVHAVAKVLGVKESPNHPIIETLLGYLKKKRLLLILDNCEHVIEEARNIAAAITRACPKVRILATSREGLGISGEELYRMPSLDVPLAGQSVTAHAASHYGAVALFNDRALSVDKRFVLTDETTPFVVEICRRLDGIPLAIELAAARANVLAPRQLAQRLDERFRLLTGGDRTALPRQQTMRALIDWSYDLLCEEERVLLRRLSIFAGGFAFESAVAVCRNDGIAEFEIFDLLSSLVDKSLVVADVGDGATRYRLLESTRQYAQEKLQACSEFEAVSRAHALAYVRLGEYLETAWDTTPDRSWFARAEPELENWWAAMEWALSSREHVALGQRLAGALRFVWIYLGVAKGRRWVQAALESVDDATPAAVIAKLDLTQAQLDVTHMRYKASYAMGMRALARYRELGDRVGIAEAQWVTGDSLVFLGRIAEGELLLEEALVSARKLGARKLTGRILRDTANARHFAGDLAGTRAVLAEALSIFKAAGAERGAASVACNLAEAEFSGGDAREAVRLAAESLAANRALHDAPMVELANLSAYLITLERYDEARTLAREALTLARDAQADINLAFSLQHVAAIAALRPQSDPERAQENHARAARLLGWVEKRLGALEAVHEYTEQQEYDKMCAALRYAMGMERFTESMNEGRLWSDDRAVAEALIV